MDVLCDEQQQQKFSETWEIFLSPFVFIVRVWFENPTIVHHNLCKLWKILIFKSLYFPTEHHNVKGNNWERSVKPKCKKRKFCHVWCEGQEYKLNRKYAKEIYSQIFLASRTAFNKRVKIELNFIVCIQIHFQNEKIRIRKMMLYSRLYFSWLLLLNSHSNFSPH